MKQAAGQKRKRGTDADVPAAGHNPDAAVSSAQTPKTKQPPRGKQKKIFSESKGTAHLLELALSIASGKDHAEKSKVEHAKEVRAAVDDAAKKRKVARDRKKKGGDPLPPLPSAKSNATKRNGKGKLRDAENDQAEYEDENDDIEKVSRVDDGVVLPKLKSKAQLRADIKQKERDRARKRKTLRKQSQNPAEEPAPEPTTKKRKVAFA